jgi:hypothetical protein
VRKIDAPESALEGKIDILIRLMALNLIDDRLPLKENAGRLSRAGLGPKEIAALCNTTPNTVSVALSTAKR